MNDHGPNRGDEWGLAFGPAIPFDRGAGRGHKAHMSLFDDDPPIDSRVFALRELSAAATPADQAIAIVEHRIPYRVAATVVRQMTPTVLVALIEQMSSQDLINNLGSLKRRGALDISEVYYFCDFC